MADGSSFCASQATTFACVLSLAAAILTIAFTLDCSFFHFEGDQVQYGIGLYQQGLEYEPTTKYAYRCDFYESGEWSAMADAPLKVARGMATTAALLTIPVYLMIVWTRVMSVVCRECMIHAAVACFVQTTISLLSLIALASKECTDNLQYHTPCQLGRSSFLCMSAGILWCLSGVCMLFAPGKAHEDEATGEAKQSLKRQQEELVSESDHSATSIAESELVVASVM